MKVYWLFLLCIVPSFIQAQSSTEDVKRLLDESLRTHVVNLHPPKGCPCNECAHTYTKGLKITRHQEVGGTLRVYGLAKIQFKSAFSGGEDTIEFYAEFRKVNGETVLTRLRWRKNDCMRYETLYEQS